MAKKASKKEALPANIKATHFIVLKVEKDSPGPVMNAEQLETWARNQASGTTDYGAVTVVKTMDEDPLAKIEDLEDEIEKLEEGNEADDEADADDEDEETEMDGEPEDED